MEKTDDNNKNNDNFTPSNNIIVASRTPSIKHQKSSGTFNGIDTKKTPLLRDELYQIDDISSFRSKINHTIFKSKNKFRFNRYHSKSENSVLKTDYDDLYDILNRPQCPKCKCNNPIFITRWYYWENRKTWIWHCSAETFTKKILMRNFSGEKKKKKKTKNFCGFVWIVYMPFPTCIKCNHLLIIESRKRKIGYWCEKCDQFGRNKSQ